MRINQDLSFSEKIVIRLASPFTWILILCLAVGMAFGILFFSDNIIIGQIEPSSTGWENFWKLFKAPLSVLLGGTTVYGILLAIRRTIILEEQMRLTLEQHKINSQNILMNNYYRHQDEFIKMLRNYRGFNVLYGTQGYDYDLDFYRILYISIFGKSYESTNRILSEKMELIQRIIDEILKLFPNNKIQKSNFVAKALQDLGFNSKIKPDHVHIGQNSMEANIQDSLKLLVKILEFSNQDYAINKLNELRSIIFK